MEIDAEIRQIDRAIAYLAQGDTALAQGRLNVAIERIDRRIRQSCACKGFGPQARIDGYRWDSAGVDAPCPDCGATAGDHHLRVVGGGK